MIACICSNSTIENTIVIRQICSKLTVRHNKNVIVVVLVPLLLTLTYFGPLSSISIVDFEYVNVW